MKYDQQISIANGEIRVPSVHDYLLTGLHAVPIAGEQVALILTCETEHETIELFLPDVKLMRFDSFLEGNIIFDLEVGSVEQLTGKELAWLSGVDNLTETQITREFKRLAGCHTLTLSASYGCSGIAVLGSTRESWKFSTGNDT